MLGFCYSIFEFSCHYWCHQWHYDETSTITDDIIDDIIDDVTRWRYLALKINTILKNALLAWGIYQLLPEKDYLFCFFKYFVYFQSWNNQMNKNSGYEIFPSTSTSISSKHLLASISLSPLKKEQADMRSSISLFETNPSSFLSNFLKSCRISCSFRIRRFLKSISLFQKPLNSSRVIVSVLALAASLNSALVSDSLTFLSTFNFLKTSPSSHFDIWNRKETVWSYLN